jgi:acetyltransferase-like isoleucine patch superfamily enzyme
MAAPFVFVRRRLGKAFEGWRRLQAFAALQAGLVERLPASTVVLGPAQIYGTGKIRCGEGLLIYPNQYWETQEHGEISIGDGVVLSSGVHLVAYAGIFIGKGTMIGEYTSVRDANHMRDASKTLRDAGHSAKPIVIGSEVWIGRGVTVLSGVSIGDGATVGANAVVTRDVPAGAVVAGVPAVPIQRRNAQSMELPR